MGTPNSQIGQSAEVQWLRYISKQLDQLIKVSSKCNSCTTTTSTTVVPTTTSTTTV
jgi:hypothetical protein